MRDSLVLVLVALVIGGVALADDGLASATVERRIAAFEEAGAAESEPALVLARNAAARCRALEARDAAAATRACRIADAALVLAERRAALAVLRAEGAP